MDAETEGFDIETGEWQEGYEVQREAWEKAHAQPTPARSSTSPKSARPPRPTSIINPDSS
jgi:hypothetical protein